MVIPVCQRRTINIVYSQPVKKITDWITVALALRAGDRGSIPTRDRLAVVAPMSIAEQQV